MALYSCVLHWRFYGFLFTNRTYEAIFIPSIGEPMIADFAACLLCNFITYKGWYL